VQASRLAPHLAGKRVPLSSVPVVDFAPFRDGTLKSRAQVAGAIADACRQIGFFYLVNHSVPQTLLDRVLTNALPAIAFRRTALGCIGFAALSFVAVELAMPNFEPLSMLSAIFALGTPLTAHADHRTIHGDQFVITIESNMLYGTDANGATADIYFRPRIR